MPFQCLVQVRLVAQAVDGVAGNDWPSFLRQSPGISWLRRPPRIAGKKADMPSLELSPRVKGLSRMASYSPPQCRKPSMECAIQE